MLDRAYDILFIDGSFSFADCRLIAENGIFLECMCANIRVYISTFLTTILLSEKKYTNKDMMLEWRKQAGQMGKMQMTLCNTANSLIGSLNRNTQKVMRVNVSQRKVNSSRKLTHPMMQININRETIQLLLNNVKFEEC